MNYKMSRLGDIAQNDMLPPDKCTTETKVQILQASRIKGKVEGFRTRNLCCWLMNGISRKLTEIK